MTETINNAVIRLRLSYQGFQPSSSGIAVDRNSRVETPVPDSLHSLTSVDAVLKWFTSGGMIAWECGKSDKTWKVSVPVRIMSKSVIISWDFHFSFLEKEENGKFMCSSFIACGFLINNVFFVFAVITFDREIWIWGQ